MRAVVWATLLALAGFLAQPVHAAAPTCVAGSASAAPSASLSFIAPTTNTNGTPVSGPLTYVLLAATSSGAEKVVASGLMGPSPIVFSMGLTNGSTWYFELEVVDSMGDMSAPSNEVCKSFPAAVPSTVTITIS